MASYTLFVFTDLHGRWFTIWWEKFRSIDIDIFLGLDWKREKVRLPDGTESWQGPWERIHTKGRKNLEWQFHNRVWGLDDSKDIVRLLIKKSHPNLATPVAIHTPHRQRIRIMSENRKWLSLKSLTFQDPNNPPNYPTGHYICIFCPHRRLPNFTATWRLRASERGWSSRGLSECSRSANEMTR